MIRIPAVLQRDRTVAREIPELRLGIVHILQMLSSREEQLDYERRVPGISVPTELLSLWFDDQYSPESESFRLCFSGQEMEALSAFNGYFEIVEKRLPEPRGGIKTWLEDENWRGIMREAARTLTALNSESTNPE